MNTGNQELDDFCRRQWRLRSGGVRNAIDRRKSQLAGLAGNLNDSDRLARDLSNRILRAQSSAISEE